jgi:hypothetical protein
MAVFITEDLDANSAASVSQPLALTTETIVTLYVFHKDGPNSNHRVVLQASPVGSGGKWRQVGQVVNGIGAATVSVAAQRVRAKLFSLEGADSSVEIHIVAN